MNLKFWDKPVSKSVFKINSCPTCGVATQTIENCTIREYTDRGYFYSSDLCYECRGELK